MDNFIKNLARGAGAILREGYQSKFKVSTKAAEFDFLTKYDLAAEEFITSRIRRKYPNHGILAEESGDKVKGRKNFWIIDPMDGTYSFVRRTYQFSVSIAFVNGGRVKLGVVYAPMQDELFFAADGRGAKLNGRRMEVAQSRKLQYANIVSMVRSNMDNVERERLLKKIYNQIIIKNAMWTDRMNSCALSGAYIAAGRYDCMVSKGLWAWDYAAAALLIKEAGGKVTDFRGRPYTWKSDEFVAGNPAMHGKVIKVLRKL